MTKLLNIILTGFITIMSFAANAAEMSTSNFNLVKEQIDKLGKNDLLITDVMGVLFYQGDRVISPLNKDRFKKYLHEIEQKHGEKKRILLKSIIESSFETVPVETKLNSLIMDTQKRGVKVIVLTSGRTGSFGIIEDRIQLRINRLRQLGLNFSKTFEKDYYLLDKIEEKKEGKPSIYKNGVIFTNRNDKGKSLEVFLNEVSFKPRKIIYIDNKMRQVDSVRKACDKMGIQFVGIHYTKVFENEGHTVDEEIAKKQFEYLEKKLRWLSDDQAKCMMQNNDDFQACKDA